MQKAFERTASRSSKNLISEPSMKRLPLDLLDSHPDNPRLELRENVIAAITTQLRCGPYDEAYAILVRPLGDRYQIINGHHRVESARRADLTEIPAWVRNYTDEEAFMLLILSNAQTGLTPLERGKHAADAVKKYGDSKNGKPSMLKYAKKINPQNPEKERVSICRSLYAWEVYEELDSAVQLRHKFHHLVIIHSAPQEKWAELAERMVAEEWTTRQTEESVRALHRKATPRERKVPDYIVTLDDWKAGKRPDLSKPRHGKSQMNEQASESIDWAKWSWNPVTGCLHNCPYCYARDLAVLHYPTKFEPAIWPDRLRMPYNTVVPKHAERDPSYRNVFTCSMADLFGSWVPKEWIEAVLKVVADNPQWNFLFLTKFPQRMAEFVYPDNAWLGTTVDLQARVKNAERAMAKVKAKVKWLSLEPLIEPLEFDDLSAFQWIVIGGASRSSETPEWQPPRRWVWELTFKAQDAGCLVYHKTNLHNRLKMFPGDAFAEAELQSAPAQFHYLKVIQ